KMDDQALHLLICESRMDGFFDEADAWHLGEGGEGLARQAKSRSLGKHAWLGEAAYRMVELDPNGHWIRIQAFDPGITRKEEELQEDVYRADRMAKRAPAPLAFSHNFEEALAEAKSKGVPLLLDFETTWCGPCKLMDQLVYGALDVVNAATKHRIVAVKVDGDERRDLVEQYKVEGYPTILLIAPDGTLTRRVIGYQSVAEMTNFIDS
ncbi:MAG: thiol-disulfide isomerase/thioredoxin, partial [Planctomycetota bacterium]